MPFYGDTKLFKESILSVLGQSSPQWRLLILNDAHPDFSIDEWIHSLSDDRITYIRNESNLGPSLAYSRCLELIEGTHCVILGADDLLMTTFVERAINAIESYPGHAFYHPYVDVIDEMGNSYLPMVDRVKQMLTPKVLKPASFDFDKIMKSILIGNWMYFPAIVWNLEELKEFGFREDLNVCQDLWLIAETLLAGKSILLFPEKIFRYRRFQGSDSSIKLLNGVRFKEEKSVFKELGKHLFQRRYWQNGFYAWLHLTSRAHALSLVPQAIKSRRGLIQLIIHTFG